jgi:hypothetical protein
VTDAERPEPRGPQFQPDPAAPPGSQAVPPPNPYGQPYPGAAAPGQQGQPYGGPQQPGPYPGGPPSYNAIPGAPYGPGPGTPGGPGGPGPYGPSAAGGAGGGKKSRLPLILVAAGVAFLLVVGLTIAALRSSDDGSVATGPASTSSSEPPADAAKPTDAVRGFLEAVAASDGERAVSYLRTPPADLTFMSRPVLEASAEAAPLTEIDVPEVTDEYISRVVARYKLGKQAVVEEFSVSETGGVWKITRGANEFDLSYQRDETLGLLINGVAVDQDKVTLLPGTYAFTSNSKWVDYGDKATLTLTGPSDYTSPRLTPTLTKDAKAAFLKTTKAVLDKCLEQRKLAPKNCPNQTQARENQKIDEDTVRWSLENDPFKNARVALDYQDPSVVEATFYPRYDFRAEGTQDGRRANFDTVIGLYSFRSTGDLSGDTIKVELEVR